MAKYRDKQQYREIHPKIFIWSHTDKAEIEYFQDFKNYLRTPLLMPKKEVCGTPHELLAYVIKWKRNNVSREDGDQVSCIFDVDDFYKNNRQELIKTITHAEKNNIKIAYSNECFELWILLHFLKPTSAMCRGKTIEEKIQIEFKKYKLGEFRKNRKVFNILLPFQRNAIKNGTNLLPEYNKIDWHQKLSKAGNPSTSIHFLVKEIHRTIGR
jgi:hypothetical protein